MGSRRPASDDVIGVATHNVNKPPPPGPMTRKGLIECKIDLRNLINMQIDVINMQILNKQIMDINMQINLLIRK